MSGNKMNSSFFSIPELSEYHVREISSNCHACVNGFETEIELEDHITCQHPQMCIPDGIMNDELDRNICINTNIRMLIEVSSCEVEDKEICFDLPLASQNTRHHTMATREKKIYKCNSCEEQFFTNAALKMHKNKLYKCKKTVSRKTKEKGIKAKDKTLINSNINPRLQEEADKCDVEDSEICLDLPLISKNNSLHTMKTRKKTIHKCNFCREQFFTSGALKMHTNKPYSCKKNQSEDKCNDENLEVCKDLSAALITYGASKFLLNEPPMHTKSPSVNYEDHDIDFEGIKYTEANSATLMTAINTNKNTQWQRKYGHISTYKKGTHKCKICFKLFRYPSKLERHMILHTGEKLYKCYLCNKKFAYNFHLVRHLQWHKNEKIHTCKICHKKCSLSWNLKQHMLLHTGEKKHKCEVCQRRFTQRSALKQHIKIHTGKKHYKCGFCQKKFTQSSTLKNHMLIHTREEIYECEVCRERFTQFSDMKEHLILHTGEKKHKCKVCLKEFTQGSYLKKHMILHTGEKSHKCDVCHRTFTSKSGMKCHMNVHTSKENHKCEVCQKIFPLYSSLKTHMLIHREKKYKCEICPRKVTSPWHLKKHMVAHGLGKKNKCELCQKEFTQVGYLKQHMILQHMLIQTGEEKHQCKVCQKEFTQHSSLKQHMEIHAHENIHNFEMYQKTSGFQSSPKHINLYKDANIHKYKDTESPLNHIKINTWDNNHENFHFAVDKVQTENQLDTSSYLSQFELGKENQSLVSEHQNIAGTTKHSCIICNEMFEKKCYLLHHMNIHKTDNEYKCDFCDKTFLLPSPFEEHLKVHKREVQINAGLFGFL